VAAPSAAAQFIFMERHKMTRPIHRTYNPDGSFNDVPYTDDEMAQLEIDKKTLDQIKADELKQLTAKETAKAKLEALGLSIDDLKALGLG
jgi:hypothetical protein